MSQKSIVFYTHTPWLSLLSSRFYIHIPCISYKSGVYIFYTLIEAFSKDSMRPQRVGMPPRVTRRDCNSPLCPANLVDSASTTFHDPPCRSMPIRRREQSLRDKKMRVLRPEFRPRSPFSQENPPAAPLRKAFRIKRFGCRETSCRFFCDFFSVADLG